jgi:hypothetical protein
LGLFEKTGGTKPDNFLPVWLSDAVEVHEYVTVAGLARVSPLSDGVQLGVGEEIHLVEAAGEALHHLYWQY